MQIDDDFDPRIFWSKINNDTIAPTVLNKKLQHDLSLKVLQFMEEDTRCVKDVTSHFNISLGDFRMIMQYLIRRNVRFHKRRVDGTISYKIASRPENLRFIPPKFFNKHY